MPTAHSHYSSSYIYYFTPATEVFLTDASGLSSELDATQDKSQAGFIHAFSLFIIHHA